MIYASSARYAATPDATLRRRRQIILMLIFRYFRRLRYMPIFAMLMPLRLPLAVLRHTPMLPR